MISKKIGGREEKKNLIGKSLKIIFLAVFIILVFPKLVEAWCGAACNYSGGSYDTLDECNGGVTICAGYCGWGGNLGKSDVGYICKSGTPPCGGIGSTIVNWSKHAKFPDTSNYNGRPCGIKSNFTCDGNGSGVWNASEKKCIQCTEKKETKICGSAGTTSIDTCNAGLTYCLSLGCAAAGDGEFETACTGVDPKCDDKLQGNSCGAGGTCDANGQCFGEIVPPLCSNGALDPGEQCDPGPPVQDAACPGQCQVNCTCPAPPPGNCELDCSCTCAGIPCPGGRCDGGLVPCGRTCDDKCTQNCECAPCTLCHLFVLFKRIVDFLTINIIFPLAILMIVVGGVMFLTAGGDPGRSGTARKILTATIIGLVIILTAWLLVNTVIMFLVPAGSPFQDWSTIDCPVCGDGPCDSGEDTTNCPADCGAPPPGLCSPPCPDPAGFPCGQVVGPNPGCVGPCGSGTICPASQNCIAGACVAVCAGPPCPDPAGFPCGQVVGPNPGCVGPCGSGTICPASQNCVAGACVAPSTCSSYNISADCTGAGCKWCPKCSAQLGNQWDADQCITTATPCNYWCSIACGSLCEDDGDCGGSTTCERIGTWCKCVTNR